MIVVKKLALDLIISFHELHTKIRVKLQVNPQTPETPSMTPSPPSSPEPTASPAPSMELDEVPATSKWTLPNHPQPRFFFSKLCPEMCDEVFSYIPWNEISALRRCCQQLHDAVAAYESRQAEPRVNFHMRRLQNKIDAIENASMPTNAETLLAGLSIWTSTRKMFENPEASLGSLEKWFSYLAGDQVKTKPPQPYAEFETWALVAMQAVRLHIQVTGQRRKTGYELPPRETHWAQFRHALSEIDNLPLSKAETRALFDRIRNDAPLTQRDIKRQTHTASRDVRTLPSKGKNFFRLTPIRTHVGNEDRPKGKSRYPLLPAEVLCDYLGLPTLPGSNTFCYCVKKEWVTELLKQPYKRSRRGGLMNLSMRAAALEYVEIF